MGENTKIEWCDHTFNPWIGCTKVSQGCKNCYAETMMDSRYGKVKWGKGQGRVLTSEANWKLPLKWDKEAKKQGLREKVFCASLSDVFDEEVSDEWRTQLFNLIEETKNLDWLLLTKRPEKAKSELCSYIEESLYPEIPVYVMEDWLKKIILGVSICNQKEADEKIPLLLKIKEQIGVKTFLSCEPLLGHINLSDIKLEDGIFFNSLKGQIDKFYDEGNSFEICEKIDWVIVGGESGNNARPINVEWARSIRNQCEEADVPFFFKQWGEWIPESQIDKTNPNHYPRFTKANIGEWVDGKFVEGKYTGNGECYYRLSKKNTGRLLDGREWNEFPKGV